MVEDKLNELGIQHPSDFLHDGNLGIKNGKLACFDVMGDSSKYFEDIFC